MWSLKKGRFFIQMNYLSICTNLVCFLEEKLLKNIIFLLAVINLGDLNRLNPYLSTSILTYTVCRGSEADMSRPGIEPGGR